MRRREHAPRALHRRAIAVAAPLTNRRVVAGNSLVLIAGEAATRAISFLAIAYLSRTLRPDGVGAVEFGFAVFSLVQLIGMGGVEAVMIRAAARHPEDVPTLAGRSLLLAGGQLVAAIAVLVTVGTMLDLSPVLRTSAVLFGVAALVVPAAMRFVFIAGEQAWVPGVANVAGQLVFLVLCVGLVHAPEHAARVGLFWIVAVALRTAVGLVAYVQRYGGVVLSTDRFGAWFRRTALVGFGSLAAGLMTSIDVVILGVVRGSWEVAGYGLATKLPIFLSSLVGLVYTALFPTLVRAVSDHDDARIARIGTATLALGLGIAIPGALALGSVADPLMGMLFGHTYRAAGPVLTFLMWRFPLTAAVGLFQSVAWAQSPEREARVAVTVLLVTMAILPLGAIYGSALGANGGALGVSGCMLIGQGVAVVLFARATAIRGLLVVATMTRVLVGSLVTVALLHWAAPFGESWLMVMTPVAWLVGSGIATAPVLVRFARG